MAPPGRSGAGREWGQTPPEHNAVHMQQVRAELAVLHQEREVVIRALQAKIAELEAENAKLVKKLKKAKKGKK